MNFLTLDLVPETIVEAAGGNFGTQRYLTLLSPTRDRLKTLIAVEAYTTDGPFDRAQDYLRFNLFAKASTTVTEDLDVAAWASYLRSDWFGSGQIPERAVRAGLIGRFGSIDNSEGGRTQRLSLNADVRWRLSDSELVSVHAYGQYYQLDLFSDFTFFLNDPANGDQIQQVDRNRLVAGLDAQYERRSTVLGVPVVSTAGVQFRLDRPRVVLAHTADRHVLERTQDVRILEMSYSPFLKLDLAPLPWLRFVTGARGDVFRYEVHNNLSGVPDQPDGRATRAIASGKANLILGPWYRTELFANFGTGFHSNDARAVIVDRTLPALAQATAYEFGVRTRALPRLEMSATYWVLDLASELVFNGDQGTTEARGASHREGFEFTLRAKLSDWLVFSGDVTTTSAKFFSGSAVPLAPRVTARGELTARLPWGLAASIGMRYLGNRYASEDRTQTARGYTLFDLTARYRHQVTSGLAIEAFANIENLFNVEWREAQFFFASRLRGEPPDGMPDIHFTPGNPRTILGGLAARF